MFIAFQCTGEDTYACLHTYIHTPARTHVQLCVRMSSFGDLEYYVREQFEMLVKAVPGGLSPRAHLEALAGYAMSDYEYYVSVMGLLGTFGLLVVVWGCRICREGELADKSAARGNAGTAAPSRGEPGAETSVSDVQELQRILESRLNTLTSTTKEIDKQLDRLDKMVDKRERDRNAWQNWLPLIVSTCAFVIALRRR